MDPKFIQKITLEELQQQWPDSDQGRLCARLLQRYCFTFIIQACLEAECTEQRSQAESGATKAIAKMVCDFGTLVTPPKPPEAVTTMKQLNRFQNQKPTNEPK